MRLKRTLTWIGGLIGLVATFSLGYHYFILDWSGRPFCHKIYNLAFRTWMDEFKTNAFPNIGGLSSNSLMAIREEMGGGMRWSEHYRYVPGLRQDDPGRLILLYFDMPTRWTWHGRPPTIFTKRAWIVVPVDFAEDLSRPRSGGGELSERLTTEQFKRRLGETLEFIRTNERPHWQKVVEEHTRLLKSIEDAEN